MLMFNYTPMSNYTLLPLLLLLWAAPLVLHAQSPDARVIRGDLAVSDDGATVATSTGTGTLLLWNADSWTLLRRHIADGSMVFGFDFTEDGRYVSFGTKDGRLGVL